MSNTALKTENHNGVGLGTRRAGLLLHPTSLPGHCQLGCMDGNARKLIDFMSDAGFSVWQTLPLGPTHADLSPYNCISVYAINPMLLDPKDLSRFDWSGDIPDCHANSISAERQWRKDLVSGVWSSFNEQASLADKQSFELFRHRQNYWLEDYALYCAIRENQGDKAWIEWPEPLRQRDPQALAAIASQLETEISIYAFEQFLLETQWHELREYAHRKNILLFGDMPIYVAHDSAEVWGHRENFSVNDKGELTTVAGVPPDYFSETGQLWGNPLYQWDLMRDHRYEWWVKRLKRQFELFDIVRLDHFRGFEAYWEIPAGAETALEGHWEKAPGDELFLQLKASIPDLALVAEDLGVITDEVTTLRHNHELPGMKVLQFGFDGKPDNPHLPANYDRDYVVYTGTHDNDTTLAWFRSLHQDAGDYVMDQLDFRDEEMPWPMIKTALASKANWAILPMQDVLGLGEGNRMNTPGTETGNWTWRFAWSAVDRELVNQFRQLIEQTGRYPG